MKIGITLTSSLEVGQEYIALTEEVARKLAAKNMGIVYGGTAYGMMSSLAMAYKQAGGNDLNGVLAKDLMAVTKNYIAFDDLDHLFIEESMEDRMHRIVELSDAFLILPGGYGTIEEIGTIIGGRVNKLLDKPIAIYNYKGFYDTLLIFLDEIQSKAFSKISKDKIMLVSDDLDKILSYFQDYQTKEIVDKFV